ncbi:MAG: hypothetical protein E5W98_19935 [Mesorhizobium sp.]|uniref:hypothetical protein n=1 Tax=Mesorhizobium sp. TaxID=1871066 RepID=UPI00121D2194|nr:hypothetical protein [Mesorhizobium sp.]TIT04443.1 MAG: hypothetical protein E5W87_00240 [Mesorhizobium sp.]TKD40830.1 MAG: hypothetical protein E5W98_19935 [Mesorhizobium sp.]
MDQTDENSEWGDSDALEFFGRHLLAICITYRLANTSKEDALSFAAYNGTLIDIAGSVCFLTAGHVLADLKQKIADIRVEIVEVVLADTFAKGRISDKPVPFDIRSEPFLFVDDEEQGLDFGAIPLRPYYVNLLAKNGMVALDEERWIHQHRVDFDGYAMLGLPREFTSPSVDTLGHGAVSPTMIWVSRRETPPQGTRHTTYPRFIAEIGESLSITDIVGMSGGPIFGFRIDGEKAVRYWVVALQSAWLPRQRIIFGCPLPTLAPLLKGLMAEASSPERP